MLRHDHRACSRTRAARARDRPELVDPHRLRGDPKRAHPAADRPIGWLAYYSVTDKADAYTLGNFAGVCCRPALPVAAATVGTASAAEFIGPGPILTVALLVRVGAATKYRATLLDPHPTLPRVRGRVGWGAAERWQSG